MKNCRETQYIVRVTTLTVTLLLALLSVNSFAADEPRFTAQTSMAVILDNPAAKAVMTKYIPAVMADPQIEGARVISIGELATYIPSDLTPEVMAKLLAELNTLEE